MEARVDYLVENYRSSRHIVNAANALIAAHRERMKTDHPIRINHARQNEAAGGRWHRLDRLVQGRVHVLAVPDDRIGQAAVVMAEMQRLKSLAPDSDWSGFAILARNRATLEPVRAWCERENVPYRLDESEAKGHLKFHQTREANWLLDLLRGKPGRCLKPGALLRWFHARFASLSQDNPRLAQLGLFIDELDSVWSAVAIPASLAIAELYEFSADVALTEKGRLTLSTVHGAKGREFRHVAILDGGNWKQASDDERRLYYVGMTRAQETLTLCEAMGRTNPFSPGLDGVFLIRSPLPQPLPEDNGLDRRYLSLRLAACRT